MAKKVGERNGDIEMQECMTCIKIAFEKHDVKYLRDITKKCEKNIIIDEQIFFNTALLAYTLSKILQKSRYRVPKLYQSIIIKINQGVEFAKKRDEVYLLRSIDNILKCITSFDERNKRYVIGLIEKGRTKIAASLYAQGLSLSRVISITGAQKQEVLNYSGKTIMSDRVGKTIEVKERLKNAKEIVE